MPPFDLDDLLRQNPDAPTNDDFARQMANKLFPPRNQRDEAPVEFSLAEGASDFAASDDEEIEWCGETSLGLLEAALASNLLSQEAKNDIDTIISDSQPSILEKSKTIGHFRFRWTESSPDSRDNTNEPNIDATAAFLNQSWDRFSAELRQPKADLVDGERMIDVEVYYNPGLHGSTSSQTNRIFLNSLTVVNDDCRRQTTSAHELFHRVEYAYGYVTGTPGQRWWVEALGSWSQEYQYPDIDDYITRVNAGLSSPQKNLLERSYDACHFWKYLGEQIRNRTTLNAEYEAIGEVLDTYAANGLDAKAAVGTVTDDRLGRSFHQFFQDWTKANFLKDLDRPSSKYDYDEDEQVTHSCGRTYGPYGHVVPVDIETIKDNAFSWSSGQQSVSPYGTDYYVFPIEPDVTRFSLRFDGGSGGPYSAHLLLIKANRWRRIYNSPSTTERVWDEEFPAETYDRCALVVNGLADGGDYTVSINSCMTGLWRDGFNFVWTLTQSGTDVTGSVQTSSCGIYSVTGNITDGDITLQASGPCADFMYEGTVDDCESGSGRWTNDSNGSGTWTMTKIDGTEAMAIVEGEEIEFGDDPTTSGW